MNPVLPVLVIGAGHNGLTAAFYLAKAGLKPLVLERRSVVGGAAITGEIAPGYACATLAHAIGPVRASVARDMQLARRGVEFLHPDPRLIALSPDGRALEFASDAARTAEAIRAFSPKDAGRYPEFCSTMARLGGFLSGILESTPPSLSAPGTGELWDLLKVGRRFRALGRKDGYRLLRWGPMAVADLVAEWFETDLLQAAIAARGIFGTAQGPWSAGTGALLLLNAAIDPAPGGSSVTIKGGPGALTSAMAQAAREAGAEIRTGAAVARVSVRDGRATGVILEDGDGDPGIGGGVECRSPPHLPGTGGSDRAGPGLPGKNPALPVPRDGRKGEPGADGLPGFPGRREPGHSPRPASHRARHRLPRARVRRVEVRRDLCRNRISTSPSRRCRIRRWRRPAGT